LPPIEGGDVARVPLANIAITDAGIVAEDKKVSMASRLVQVGYSPAEVLAALGLPEIGHTGVPSTMLQALQNLNPEDPTSEYEG